MSAIIESGSGAAFALGSQVGPAALALPGDPLDGQHAVRVEHVPAVIARGLKESIRAEPHTEQRMFLVIEGPPRAQRPVHEPDLPWLTDHRLEQINDYLAVHSATLPPGRWGPRFFHDRGRERLGRHPLAAAFSR